jgi:hypothetical protein
MNEIIKNFHFITIKILIEWIDNESENMVSMNRSLYLIDKSINVYIQ